MLFHLGDQVYKLFSIIKVSLYIVVLFTYSLSAATLYVSPQGDDRDDGSQVKPFATIQHAINHLAGKNGKHKIIIGEGKYKGGVIMDSSDGEGPDALVITAKKNSDGSYQEVIIDCADWIDEAKPIESHPGVYIAQIPRFMYHKSRPDMYEVDTQVRYFRLPDLESVKTQPGSFTIEPSYYIDTVYFHSSDSDDYKKHQIGHNFYKRNFEVTWNHVTVRGIKIHHGGFIISNCEGVILEDCFAWNTRGGFSLGGSAKHTILRRCSARDVGFGVKNHGFGTLIEDGYFERKKSAFESHLKIQDASGIQCYSPAKDFTIRRNFTYGFRTGIFCKSTKGKRVIEYNTCVKGESIGIGLVYWRPGTVVRYNIVSGYVRPYILSYDLWMKKSERMGFIFDYNLAWNAENKEELLKVINQPIIDGSGRNNIIADPRFAAPELGDYRLMPDSPCASLAPGNQPIGKFGVVRPTFIDKDKPQLKVNLSQPAIRMDLLIRKYRTIDPWNVGLSPGSKGVPKLQETLIEKGAEEVWSTPNREIQIQLQSKDNIGFPTKMRFKIGESRWSSEEPFLARKSITLPDGDEIYLAVQVCDQAGNWSDVSELKVYLSQKVPKLEEFPTLYTNDRGVVFSFKSSVPAQAYLEWGSKGKYENKTKIFEEDERVWSAEYGELINKRSKLRTEHTIALIDQNLKTGTKYHSRIVLNDGLGHIYRSEDIPFTSKGKRRTYVVDPLHGINTEKGGTESKPFRSIQFAIDRALPGDTIILEDGIYRESVYINHGGSKGWPLTLKARNRGKAILDGGNRELKVLRLYEAPHVVIDGLETRWFAGYGISVVKSDYIVIQHCRIWNNHWFERRKIGTGIGVMHSRGVKLYKNLIFAMNWGFQFFFSPEFNMQYCTIAGGTHGGGRFTYSTRNSIFKNNSSTFVGNYNVAIAELEEDWNLFQCDYNNLAAIIRKLEKVRPENDVRYSHIKSNYRYWAKSGKHIYMIRFGWGAHKRKIVKGRTMKGWFKGTGKDKNSIFAAPHYENPLKRNFYLMPSSPNIGAGENGTTIGALGLVPE